MTEEEKKAAEEAEAEAKAEANNAEDEGKKAIEEALKIETEKRIKAENDLKERDRKAKEAFLERERKRKEAEENGDEEDEEDKPLTKKNVNKILEEREEKIRKEMREEQAIELAKKMTESDLEANLVMEIWKNRTLSGTLNEQIEEAHAIATYKRSQKQNEELKRALMGKDGENNDGFNAQRKPANKGEPNVNATDKTVLSGTWDGTKNAYKKTIAGGKKIFYVSRDLKKRWVE